MRIRILTEHLKWAQNNRDTDEGRNFLNLATLYSKHADVPTYALLMSAADGVEKLMRSNTGAKEKL